MNRLQKKIHKIVYDAEAFKPSRIERIVLKARADERAKVNAEWRERIKNSIEELSALEHDQWIGWSKAMTDIVLKVDAYETHKEMCRVHQCWLPNWKPYEELNEPTKELDRIHARKVIDKLLSGGESPVTKTGNRAENRQVPDEPAVKQVHGDDRQSRSGEKKEVK